MICRRWPPSQRGGILFKLLLCLVVLAAMAGLAWMVFLPHLVSSMVRERTGFDFKAESLMANPFTGEVRARGVVLSNPPTFPTAEFLRINEFSCQADAWSLLTDKPVFERITLDIALVALVKRADGRTNAEVFRSYLTDKNAPPTPTSQTARKRFVIRELRTRFDRLVVVDYTRAKPVRQEHAVQIDRTFKNVSDASQLLLPSSLDQLFTLGGAVGDLLPTDIGRVLEEALRSGTDLLKQVPTDVRVFPGITDTLEESKKP